FLMVGELKYIVVIVRLILGFMERIRMPYSLIKPTDGILRNMTLHGSNVTGEAVAYDNGYYYVTGSHGTSKKGGEHQRSRFFRFPVDKQTGEPGFPFDATTPAKEVEAKNNLDLDKLSYVSLKCDDLP